MALGHQSQTLLIPPFNRSEKTLVFPSQVIDATLVNLEFICRELGIYLSRLEAIFVVSGGLCRTNDQALSGRFHNFPSDTAEVVDLKDTADLRKEALKQAEVAAGDPNDAGNGFTVRKISVFEFQAESLPMMSENELHFLCTQRPEFMGKSHPGIELSEARHPLFEPRQANQD
jgi:hypothetical protein